MKNFQKLVMAALCLIVVLSSCRKHNDYVMSKIDFEDVTLDPIGYWNGSDGSGSFRSGNAIFRNYYNQDYDSWSGFSVSNHTDTITPGVANQYSSSAGSGDKGSEKYAVLYSYEEDTIEFITPQAVTNISLSLNTYAYLSMKNGDAFAKKFGGETGADPDYYWVIFTGITSDGYFINYSPVPLANFQFDGVSTMDFIWNKWMYVNLAGPTNDLLLKYLLINIESSDTTGTWINTPSYICIDNIEGPM